MNVSRRSWHYWVYTHTYVNLPNDGCSYLRKLIWACIWFIPLTLFYIPHLVVEAVKSVHYRTEFEYPVYVSELSKAFCQLLFACIFICMFILMWFYIPPVIFTDNHRVDWHAFFLIGFVGWSLVVILSVLVGLIYTIQKTIDWVKGRSRSNRKPTLLSIYIKAFKEKHCPKINIVD